MINPIETIYNGYKFRSRLEARWAVFFYTMNISYKYENEGYKFNNIYYLPDFEITNFFIEIKPEAPMSNETYDKCRGLCDLTKKDIYIIQKKRGNQDLNTMRKGK